MHHQLHQFFYTWMSFFILDAVETYWAKYSKVRPFSISTEMLFHKSKSICYIKSCVTHGVNVLGLKALPSRGYTAAFFGTFPSGAHSICDNLREQSAGTRSPHWHCRLAARRALVPGQVRELVLHGLSTTGEQAEEQFDLASTTFRYPPKGKKITQMIFPKRL